MQMLLNNRYRILRTLGGGGFGETFLAEDTQMPSLRRCVIKQLKPIQDNLQVYQLVQQRFQREAAILEDLGDGSHQIPRLYAYFPEKGQFYLVQEYIEGQTLASKLQEQGLMSESALKEILTSILPVLEYVHSKGIVHRDIKPDNILIRHADGKPVLIDFGAVKETVGTMMSPSGNSTRSIVIGTPGFMPSEQSVGRPMFASDIYSLGLTAIYLLTGKTPPELTTDHATGALVWRQYALNITPSFAAVLDKAIQFNAHERFASAREMLQALYAGAALMAPTVQVVPPTIVYTQPPATNAQPLEIPQQTIPVSPGSTPQPSPQTDGQNSGQKSVLLSSLITGGLIGASVIIGFALSREQPQPEVEQPLAQQNTSIPSSPFPSESQETAVPPMPTEPSLSEPTTTPSETLEPVLPELTTDPKTHLPKVANTPVPTQTPSSQVPPTTQSPTNNHPSPAEAVQNYYFTLNQGEYRSAWNQLVPSYQNNKRLHPNGYLSYIDWWGGKVKSVDVERVSIVEASTEKATVEAQLKYFMKAGQVVPTSVRFLLLWDADNSRWIVSDAQ
ncbi:serine/threonine-protein kinase [Mastigocladopsis repens]|uniref:serine/threonine-protein kinase n=1 Tax=Mastigocladopsis repens TaxID=221287 RepID=UPI0003051C95|nr:serine/threonine-protein kinase [Mastigocladopsis repens]